MSQAGLRQRSVVKQIPPSLKHSPTSRGTVGAVFSVEVAITGGTFAVLLLGWSILSRLNIISPLLLPSPERVVSGFGEILTHGYKGISLFQHVGDSLFRLFAAFALAVFTAVPLGLASGYNRKIRAVFEPLVEIYQALPPLAYYTILIIWFGIENSSKIALLFLAAYAPLFITSMSGVKAIQEDQVNAAHCLGANRRKAFLDVIFPASLPYIFTGLRTAMATAFTTLVAAEMVAAVSGIGWMVFDASRFLRSDLIFAGLVVLALISIVLDRSIRVLETVFVHWKGKE